MFDNGSVNVCIKNELFIFLIFCHYGFTRLVYYRLFRCLKWFNHIEKSTEDIRISKMQIIACVFKNWPKWLYMYTTTGFMNIYFIPLLFIPYFLRKFRLKIYWITQQLLIYDTHLKLQFGFLSAEWDTKNICCALNMKSITILFFFWRKSRAVNQSSD